MAIQPSLREYGFIGDGTGAALVSSAGSIDWCCLERMDRDSCFARILDLEHGGAAWLPGVEVDGRRYLDDTLVLETELRGPGGRGRALDFFDRSGGGRRLVRIVEVLEGEMEVTLRLAARFDYGALRPWVRIRGETCATLQGGDSAIVVGCDAPMRRQDDHDLVATGTLGRGERLRLSLTPARPETVDDGVGAPGPEELDAALDGTIAWWRREAGRLTVDDPGLVRSALTLRALVFEATGAIAAAATTSLPEQPGGERNWDYRFSWVRDSTFAARSLARVGMPDVADAFARFVMRTAAGSADDLQVLYGLGGERHVPERQLPLAGYRDARPVHVGNSAAYQLQHDETGEILQMCRRWAERGHVFDDDEWRFLESVVERAAARWADPDHGFWEWRGEPRHFVRAKAACWGALDCGLALAHEQGRQVPSHRWRRTRDEIAAAIDEHGYDRGRGTFVQAFGAPGLDAVALTMPTTGYVGYDDERMRRTVDVIRAELGEGRYLRRYRTHDAIDCDEGAFLACSFWLVECLAHQGRREEAREVYDDTVRAATPLGLFSEEVDPLTDEPLGNLPQGLTHLSHLTAALALSAPPR